MAKKKKANSPGTLEMRCFIACDAVSRDPSGGKSSLYGVFDVMWGDKPGLGKPFAIFLKVLGPRGTHEATIEGIGPDGKLLTDAPQAFEFRIDASSGADIIVQVGPLPFKRFGPIKFVLKEHGKAVGWPCEIQLKRKKKG